MTTARGKTGYKCRTLGYSTPGAGSAKSAQVTLCGSQNLSFQIQAEIAAMLGRIECRKGRGVATLRKTRAKRNHRPFSRSETDGMCRGVSVGVARCVESTVQQPVAYRLVSHTHLYHSAMLTLTDVG